MRLFNMPGENILRLLLCVTILTVTSSFSWSPHQRERNFHALFQPGNETIFINGNLVLKQNY